MFRICTVVKQTEVHRPIVISNGVIKTGVLVYLILPWFIYKQTLIQSYRHSPQGRTGTSRKEYIFYTRMGCVFLCNKAYRYVAYITTDVCEMCKTPMRKVINIINCAD